MPYGWLPPLTQRTHFSDDAAFIDAIYAAFERDFVSVQQNFRGLPIGVKPLPFHNQPALFAGKNGTFRHLLTEGKNEETRTIAWDRCERLGWVLPMIQQTGSADVCVWKNSRQTSGSSYVLALSDFSYKVVLTERHSRITNSPYLLLWTAFPVMWSNGKRKLAKEYRQNGPA